MRFVYILSHENGLLSHWKLFSKHHHEWGTGTVMRGEDNTVVGVSGFWAGRPGSDPGSTAFGQLYNLRQVVKLPWATASLSARDNTSTHCISHLLLRSKLHWDFKTTVMICSLSQFLWSRSLGHPGWVFLPGGLWWSCSLMKSQGFTSRLAASKGWQVDGKVHRRPSGRLTNIHRMRCLYRTQDVCTASIINHGNNKEHV